MRVMRQPPRRLRCVVEVEATFPLRAIDVTRGRRKHQSGMSEKWLGMGQLFWERV